MKLEHATAIAMAMLADKGSPAIACEAIRGLAPYQIGGRTANANSHRHRAKARVKAKAARASRKRNRT